MELRFVVPNMEKTFGNLEFAGENTTEQQRINGRMAVINRSYNLYSDVQRACLLYTSCTQWRFCGTHLRLSEFG